MLDYSPTKTQRLLGNPDKSANPTASSPACAGLAGEHCIPIELLSSIHRMSTVCLSYFSISVWWSWFQKQNGIEVESKIERDEGLLWKILYVCNNGGRKCPRGWSPYKLLVRYVQKFYLASWTMYMHTYQGLTRCGETMWYNDMTSLYARFMPPAPLPHPSRPQHRNQSYSCITSYHFYRVRGCRWWERRSRWQGLFFPFRNRGKSPGDGRSVRYSQFSQRSRFGSTAPPSWASVAANQRQTWVPASPGRSQPLLLIGSFWCPTRWLRQPESTPLADPSIVPNRLV